MKPGSDGRRIVVCVQPESSGMGALRWALDRATGWSAELVVVTSVAGGVLCGGPIDLHIDVSAAHRLEQMRSWQRDFIDRSVMWAAPPSGVRSVVEASTTYQLIRSSTLDAALLVLGGDGRSGVGRLAKRCIRSLECPVVVIEHGRPR